MAIIRIEDTLFEDASLELEVAKYKEENDFIVNMKYRNREFTLDDISYEELAEVCDAIMSFANTIKEFEEKEI